jgi:hypothetical protein
MVTAPANRWLRAVAIAFSILFGLLAIAACWIVYTQRKAIDFLSFWAAARLVLRGEAASAYDIAAHRIVEFSVSPITGLLPFPYPPPFLIAVAPFGALPYGVAFGAWIALSVAFYLLCTRRSIPLPFAFSQPAVAANLMIGQNGLLTSGIFVLAAQFLSRRPFAAGAIFGTLVIKPQLALLVPIAFLAGRQWRAIAGAAASSVTFLLLSFVLFGAAAYRGFFEILPHYVGYMGSSRWPWSELASPFAMLRWFGVPVAASLAVHAIIAAVAAALTWRAWAANDPRRAEILAAATVLIPPYLFTYDTVILVLPLGRVIADGRRPVVAAALWVLMLLPVASYFGLYPGTNTIPIAAAVCLYVFWADAREARKLRTSEAAARREAGSQTRAASRPGAAPVHPSA